jgi:glycerophosphoryl diester phosphodiesterase
LVALNLSRGQALPEDFKLPYFQAHRGFHQNDLENSLAALEEASRQGFKMVEFDVRLSQDGVPFLMHDLTLWRTHKNAEAISDLSSDLLESLGVTKLEEVFKSKQVPEYLNIEFKSESFDKKWTQENQFALCLRSLIRDPQLYGKKILISSFNPFSLWKFAKLLPEVPRALILSDKTPYFLVRHGLLLPALKVHALHVDEALLDSPSTVQKIKSKAYKLAAWTLRNRKRSFELLSWGVDSLICDPLPSNEGYIFDGNGLR